MDEQPHAATTHRRVPGCGCGCRRRWCRRRRRQLLERTSRACQVQVSLLVQHKARTGEGRGGWGGPVILFAGGEGGEGGKGGGGSGGDGAVVLGAATGDGGLGGGGGGDGGRDGDGGGKGGGEGGDGNGSGSARVETVLATGKHNRRSARKRTKRTAGARGLPRLCMGRTPRRGFRGGREVPKGNLPIIGIEPMTLALLALGSPTELTTL